MRKNIFIVLLMLILVVGLGCEGEPIQEKDVNIGKVEIKFEKIDNNKESETSYEDVDLKDKGKNEKETDIKENITDNKIEPDNTEREFETLQYIRVDELQYIKDDVYLLVLTSKDCGYCTVFREVLEDYKEKYNEIPVYFIETTDSYNSPYIEYFGIRGTPISLLIKGNEEINRLEGAKSLEKLTEFINNNLN